MSVFWKLASVVASNGKGTHGEPHDLDLMKGDRFINIEAEEGMYRYQLGCQTSSEKVK